MPSTVELITSKLSSIVSVDITVPSTLSVLIILAFESSSFMYILVVDFWLFEYVSVPISNSLIFI